MKIYSLTHNAVLKLLDVGRNVIRKFLLVLAGRIAQVDLEARCAQINFKLFSFFQHCLIEQVMLLLDGIPQVEQEARCPKRSCPSGDSNTVGSQSRCDASGRKQPNIDVVL